MSKTRQRYGLALAVSLLASILVVPGRAEARYQCPELKGSPDPSDPSAIVESYFEASSGCPVPLRQGIGHIPQAPGDFGLRHIDSRRAEGQQNHEATSYVKKLWGEAMALPGAAVGPLYICHFKQYTTNTGKQRTMKVFVDLKSFVGYAFKGIITAYWISGHKTC